MESAILRSPTVFLTSSKTLISSNFFKTPPNQIRLSSGSNEFISISSSSERSLREHLIAPTSFRLACVSSSAGESEDVLLGSSPDVVTLDVKGMMCEGCTSSVKRILESQPQVSSASVNLATEMAYVQPVPEAKVKPNWQQQLGETLAKHLTNCGFNSSPRSFPS